MPAMQRIKLVLAYQGTRYAGWQMQSAQPHLSTIQGELERVLLGLAGNRVAVHGAGRTDAGVHAEGQVCHFDIPEHKGHYDFLRIFNAVLPPDIRVLNAECVSPEFHARFEAKKKCYAYTLWSARERALPRLAPFALSTPPLDTKAMVRAAGHLTGEQDFASFQNSGTPHHSTVRTLYSITPVPGMAGPLHCPAAWPVSTWLLEGNGFLRQMVRNIMGLLVWVGLGKVAPEEVPAIVEAKNRQALPSPTAEARGLTLMRIDY